MAEGAFRVDPLVWGHGPREFEVFLEPTCPYSVKTFGKLDALLEQAGEDRITLKIRLQSQPCCCPTYPRRRSSTPSSTRISKLPRRKACRALLAS